MADKSTDHRRLPPLLPVVPLAVLLFPLVIEIVNAIAAAPIIIIGGGRMTTAIVVAIEQAADAAAAEEAAGPDRGAAAATAAAAGVAEAVEDAGEGEDRAAVEVVRTIDIIAAAAIAPAVPVLDRGAGAEALAAAVAAGSDA